MHRRTIVRSRIFSHKEIRGDAVCWQMYTPGLLGEQKRTIYTIPRPLHERSANRVLDCIMHMRPLTPVRDNFQNPATSRWIPQHVDELLFRS